MYVSHVNNCFNFYHKQQRQGLLYTLDASTPWGALKESLRQQAFQEGFHCVAFAPPTPPPHAEYLVSWLQQEAHGDMAWMAKDPQRRADPRQLLENLASILVLGINYCPGGDALAAGKEGGNGWISAYALNNDYHDTLKKRLRRLAIWLEKHLGAPVAGRLFVDTAPVLEKPVATGSGLGWQGKNSMLVSPHFGCWLFLAEYFLPLPLPPDPMLTNHCGRCVRCLQACPTDALADPYRLDASRCLAYFTVESSAPIPIRYRAAMGNRIYGCDDCVAVCPWNRFAPPTQEADFLPRSEWIAPRLLDFIHLDDAGFRALTRRSPIKRSGVVRFLRNVAVALGNWGAPEAYPALEYLLKHESPLVRAHAAWGIGRLFAQPCNNPFGNGPIEQLRTQKSLEPEAWVRAEIQDVLDADFMHGTIK